MNSIGQIAVNFIFNFIFVVAWLFGIALSKGFFTTTLSVLFPPYSWYILVQWVVDRYLI